MAPIERRLEQGDATAAARLLEAAQSDLRLRRLVDRAVADDPNLIALAGQIGALEERPTPH